MKTILHKAGTRGHANHGWLDTWHTFSFAGYHDPERVHFGALRVLNDDRIEGGGGFGRHPHDNMEIVTIVLEGVLEHRDSMGNTMVLRTDEVQAMSAGTGIFHSEYNHTPDIPVQMLQIWVFPEKNNITPKYDQKAFDPANRLNRWQVLVSKNEPGSLHISQDATFSRITLEKGSAADYTLPGEHAGAYVFMIDGRAEVAGHSLEKRDGLGISGTTSFTLNASQKSEILVIEVPVR
jgi:redox-sensitive bicupin YhaK (pirin superfamily)